MPTKIGNGPGMVSINDAFAGTTLRLSTIEQFVLDLKAGSITVPGDTNMLRGVMSRIEAIEKTLAKLGARIDAQSQSIVPSVVDAAPWQPPPWQPPPWQQQSSQPQWQPIVAEDVNDEDDEDDLQCAVSYEFNSPSQLD